MDVHVHLEREMTMNEQAEQYRYFVYYGVYGDGKIMDGTAEVFRTAPIISFDDIEEMANSVPSEEGAVMIKSFQLLSVWINGVWRPA